MKRNLIRPNCALAFVAASLIVPMTTLQSIQAVNRPVILKQTEQQEETNTTYTITLNPEKSGSLAGRIFKSIRSLMSPQVLAERLTIRLRTMRPQSKRSRGLCTNLNIQRQRMNQQLPRKPKQSPLPRLWTISAVCRKGNRQGV